MLNVLIVFVPLVFLIGFFIFVRWDRKRIERSRPEPLERKVLAKGGQPQTHERWKFWAGMSLPSSALAAASFLNPSEPPYAGKFASLRLFIYQSLGPNGGAYGWCLLTAICVFVGFIGWRTRKNAL